MAADLSAASLLLRSGTEKDYPISGPEISIGYESRNQVRVPLEGISRRHAKITFDGTDYWIEDAGSSNGTFLNGVAVLRRERLRHLDIVTLGRRADLVFVRKAVERRRTKKRGILAAWLETVDGPEAGERREIPRGSLVLGRSPASNVVVNSQLVSKAHARVERSGLELILTDLQSANGTFVDDKRIDSRVLKNGDEFSLGKARTYRVEIREGEIETSEVAPTSVVATSVLPTEWKTRLEWTPEEKAVLAKIREEFKPKAAAAGKPPPKPKAPAPGSQPAPRPQAKPEPKAEPKAPAKPEPKAEPQPPKPASVPKAEPPPRPEPPKPAAPAPPAATPPAPAPPKPPPPASALAGEETREIPRPAPSPAAPAPRPAAGLRVHLDGKVQSFAVGAGDHEIGRVPQCAVRLESPQISRRHAILHVTASDVAIEDLQSANGVYVNGKRIAGRQRIADGDVLQFGDLGFRVRVVSEAESAGRPN